jgi:hypothetical protein
MCLHNVCPCAYNVYIKRKGNKQMQVQVILKDGSKIFPIYDPTSISEQQLVDFYQEAYTLGHIIGWGIVR